MKILSKRQLEHALCCKVMDCHECSMENKGDYIQCIKELAETALAYRKVLEKLEWHSFAGEIGYVSNCAMCGGTDVFGHEEDCELAKLLREGDE